MRLHLSVDWMLIPCANTYCLPNCIKLLKKRTDKCQMKPVMLLSDFKVSSGDTVMFVFSREWCEVLVAHE